MLGVSGLMGSSGDGAAHESGGASGGSASSSVPGGGMEESGGGGNRWPMQETVALLKIRSDMDAAFRDSILKGPLWEDVSRKMAELGYHRSSKKCKEKFENVYKYNKRTKDGRASKTDGKAYRFFDQLEAFESTPPTTFNPPPPRPEAESTMAPAPPPTMPAATANTSIPMPSPHVTVSLAASPSPVSVAPPAPTPAPAHISINLINSSSPFQTPTPAMNTSNPPPQMHTFQPHFPTSMISNSTSTSSTSSDEDIQPPRRHGRKRKWKDFFDRMMKDVIHKQEELQKKFIDALERRDRDRTAREEAWRAQETARMNREHELLVQERSIAAAKDAAVIAFLQKVTDQQHGFQIPILNNNAPPPPENPQPPPQRQQQPPPPPKPVVAAPSMAIITPTKFSSDSGGGGGDVSMSGSSSRWPKAEVEALINLRTNLDLKYQDNGPKGPLWEEISAAMTKIGYNRSSKRCKEKWENINKYFKKVKESNKQRPEDSKTCPYFHQLDALYKSKNDVKNDVAPSSSSFTPGNNNVNNYPINSENAMAPIMARPEQQWPLSANQQQQQQQQRDAAMPDVDRGKENESDDNNDHDEDEDDEDDEGGGFEIVANKQPSSAAE